MKKRLKLISTIFIFFIIIASISIVGYKKNPKKYLRDGVNIVYINENIESKNFKNVINLIEESEVPLDKPALKSLEYIEGIYVLGDKNFITEKITYVGILDFGYRYPLILNRVSRYFDEEKDCFVLKERFRKKYFANKKMYLVMREGNFFISENLKSIESTLQNRDEVGATLLNIIKREKKNNLGILVLNLDKTPLVGFDEILLTGNVNSKKDISLSLKISGDSDIISSFNREEESEITEKKKLEKNRLYLKNISKNELKSFVSFLNYFLKEINLDGVFSKFYPDDFVNIKDLTLNKENLEKKVILDKDYFIYGDVDIKDSHKKNLGEINIVGVVKKQKLEIDLKLKKDVVLKLLKYSQTLNKGGESIIKSLNNGK